ncbi:cupin domain-containing protein [Roseicella sp. DB1501]|uniref:cupin domain-containing protein n=1 Tax=Roseicella sp. DB1501 TaxID=2730925 RepID=UPI0020C265E0|nr:cupin domain-containing protein [Roseicella sp. DB1501]
MILKPSGMRKLHWNVNASEWHYDLRGRGQVAEFGPDDVACIPMGFGHAIRDTGREDLEIVQTWGNGKFEEIDLDRWIASNPRYLLRNNIAGASDATIGKLKQG